MSVLNALDGVTAQGELFLPRPRSPERRWDSDFALPRYVESRDDVGRVRPFSVFRYLDALYASQGWVGFKLMYSQLRSYPEILLYLRRRRIRVIHLVRRNHLDVLISFAVKRAIGRAHILEESDRPSEIRVELPPDKLVGSLRWLQRKHDVARLVLRASRLRHLEVAYEDLVVDPEHYASIFGFLGLPSTTEPPRSNILKSREGSQSDVVRNYEDVRRVLEPTEFAALLE